jgi:hypothetical protein
VGRYALGQAVAPTRVRCRLPQIECYGHQCQGLRGTWPRMCP